jgi:hypothetical protein
MRMNSEFLQNSRTSDSTKPVDKSDAIDLIFSSDAQGFLRESSLRKPCVKVSLDHKPPICASSYCKKRPYVRVDVVEEDSVEEGHARIVTNSGIVVYMSDLLLNLAMRGNRTLKIGTKGSWKFRRLVLEGLDPNKV